MREIKFRAWDKVDKRMISIERPTQIPSNWRDVWDVMQYTGLKDRHDVEIYEGDIVTTVTGKDMVIDWDKRHASFVINRKGWAFHHFFGECMEAIDCEVIGNIYENPELVK